MSTLVSWCRHCGDDIESLDQGQTWRGMDTWNQGEHCDSSPDALHHPHRIKEMSHA
jgi:hypothetical protein